MATNRRSRRRSRTTCSHGCLSGLCKTCNGGRRRKSRAKKNPRRGRRRPRVLKVRSYKRSKRASRRRSYR